MSISKKDRNRKYHAGLKAAAFDAYGGPICAHCGKTGVESLCIDHVNENGAEHRRSIGRGTLYSWLKREGYPSGFQGLCHNCNDGKNAKERQ